MNITSRLRKLNELHPKRRFSRLQISKRTGIHENTLKRIETRALLKLHKALKSLMPKDVFEDARATVRGLTA